MAITYPCQAVSADAADVAALACELWPDHPLEEMGEEFASLLAREDSAVFLYREQGEAVGFAQCQLRHDYVEGTETSPVGYLEGIYVRKGARRQGVARKLLAACETGQNPKAVRNSTATANWTKRTARGFIGPADLRKPTGSWRM